jgi:hypothetical protein
MEAHGLEGYDGDACAGRLPRILDREYGFSWMSLIYFEGSFYIAFGRWEELDMYRYSFTSSEKSRVCKRSPIQWHRRRGRRPDRIEENPVNGYK